MHWLTSDTHFNHANIIKYCARPFESAQKMDEVLLDNINQFVKPDDTLWHLGDFCFGPRYPEKFLQVAKGYRDRINCKNIIWIHGNHDPDPESDRDSYKMFRELFNEDYALINCVINHQKITLCHYAMARWNKSHRGAVHFYGHSHAGIETWMDSIMPGRKSMDVGVDNIYKIFGRYRPISFTEVMVIMNARPGFLDHH